MGHIAHIPQSKYRALMSDVLPYERPIFFSNRSFVRFLKRYGVQTRDGKLVATKNQEDGLDEFLMLLGGKEGEVRSSFHFTISRGEKNNVRNLTVIHPYYQVAIAEFYERYRMLLIGYCNRSQSSLRYPVKVAKKQERPHSKERLVFDRNSRQRIDNGLKHYFSYECCENINYFYDSDIFYEAEKQFSRMYKTDLESCFESIRVEDLSRCVFGRKLEECEGSFVSEFAELQKRIREDKGIVIGPEFSRIFAEMILQHIDNEVDEQMQAKGYVRNVDYVFYRYVDDGFLFYNKPRVKTNWKKTYKKVLVHYGLSINKKKNHDFIQRPFVDYIAKVKKAVADLIDELVINRMSTFIGFINMQKGVFETPVKIDYFRFVRRYRLALQSESSQIESKDITVYALGLLRNQLEKLLYEFNTIYRQYVEADLKKTGDERGESIRKKYEREFQDFLQNMVKILFYLLSCDLRMVTSVRVVSMVHNLQLFVRGLYRFEAGIHTAKFPTSVINALDEVISEEVRMLYHAHSGENETMTELLNLLNLERIMIPNARISEEVLMQYLGENEQWVKRLNFFTAFELLHFLNACMGDEYATLCQSLVQWSLSKMKDLRESSAERVLIEVELLCNPQVDEGVKKNILKYLNVPEDKIDRTIRFIEKQEDMFIKWRNYKIDQEMVQFENYNVY